MPKNSKNLYAVILAGGSGTRFWPLSRQRKPKQFLNIIGGKTLFQKTLLRIRPIVKGSHVFIVANEKYKKEIQKQAASFKIPKSNILLEPKGKNTAPAICWAAARIYKKNRDAVMAVLPSDHFILNTKAFLNQMVSAQELARANYLVTLGIVPTRPETGYGYLRTRPKRRARGSILLVEKFTEKPDLKTAKAFIKRKNYLWNSGMFVWRCDTILQSFRKHLPAVYKVFKDKSDAAFVRRHWDKLPSISIDYGILEKAANVAAVPANIGWSDLGSWESLSEIVRGDRKGNKVKGDVLQADCEKTLVWGGKRLIATVGLKDLIIVDTDDALLVCRAQSSQGVKQIVSSLGKKRRTKIL